MAQTRSDYNVDMKTLTLTEAKAKFSEVVDDVIDGAEIVVTRMGVPAVRITKYKPVAKNKKLGLFKGQIKIATDFDEWGEEEAIALGIKGRRIKDRQ